jgi:hypothetical protein
MLWLTFRQFRLQAVVAGVLLTGLAVVVVIVGAQALSAFHASLATCARGAGPQGACSGATNDFVQRYKEMGQWLSALVLVVPGLVGVFWGAPLVAREFETGTFRLAWTQSISRSRWTLCKLGLLGLAGMAVAGLCSLLVTWSSSPLDQAVGVGPFAHFDTRGIVPIGYAAFAFALGVAVGTLIRHTVPAIGATLVSFAAVRLAFTAWIRPHLMSPLVSHQSFSINSPNRIQIGNNLPQGSWMISQSYVTPSGHAVGGGGLLNLGSATVGAGGVKVPDIGTCANIHPSAAQLGDPQAFSGLVARCVNQLHLTSAVTYQPASRFWPFQTYETLIFFALALAIGAGTVWWVRHRLG